MADRYRIGSADDSPMQPSTIYWQDDSGELSWLCEERRISPVMLGQLLADANAGAAMRKEPLQGRCECGGYEVVGQYPDDTFAWNTKHSNVRFCSYCGSHLNPDGTATPNPAYKPGE